MVRRIKTELTENEVKALEYSLERELLYIEAEMNRATKPDLIKFELDAVHSIEKVLQAIDPDALRKAMGRGGICYDMF